MAEGKQAILEVLDQSALLLPARVHDAIDANGRVKYYLSLLQLACAHADAPDAPPVDLSAERERLHVDEPELDGVVAGAHLSMDERYVVPRLGEIIAHVDEDLARMLAPVALADGAEAESLKQRLESIRSREAELVDGDRLSSEALAWLTSVDPARDGTHRFCMDLHKAIDQVEARLATETVDGARVFGLTDVDRPLVSAFMRGVHRTERLKFGHPGLGTTATRSGPRLVLENDVGMTEAHVVVIDIEGRRASITMADVHVQRLAFFQRMLSDFQVAWHETRSRRAPGLADDEFFLGSGTFEASSGEELAWFLEHLGSRLVFLIDWNKARKALQAFVPKSAAVPLLDWAASEEVGHRAFLEMGGEQLVYDAMAAVLRTPVRFGERLEDAIGAEPARGFLRFVLRETAEGLLEGRSRSLVRERVRAELAGLFAAAGERLVEPVRRHAAIVLDLASSLATMPLLGGSAVPREVATRAKERESEADQVVVEVRSLVERIPEERAFWRMVEAADDAADDIEEAAFALTLLPPGFIADDEVRATIRRLAELVVAAANAWVACVDSAPHSVRGGAIAETQPFLDAVDRVVTIEHEADEAGRHAAAALMAREGIDARALVTALGVGQQLEAATDALMHAALTLRDHVFGAVMIERR
ncbi:MAG TPA: DUF47 family protein [Polyangiaceae bacterium]|nr:DUF47 family protein [Polyangiaceae bacterium]